MSNELHYTLQKKIQRQFFITFHGIFMEVMYYITITCNWEMGALHITFKKGNDYNALLLHIIPVLIGAMRKN